MAKWLEHDVAILSVFYITPRKAISNNKVIPEVTVKRGQSLGNSLLAYCELGGRSATHLLA